MASSSRATAQPSFSYDVFLSFRGEDTRESFTDHLYTALKQAGIRTFRDDDAMERGKLLKPALDKAIRESAISVIVFSESYASSKWCLDEVMMIIEEHETLSSKHEVIPVFYKVDPSDVRNQRGSFKEAFDVLHDEIKAEKNRQKRKELSEKVEAWRDSLRKAATLTGLVYKDGYESPFVNNIVNIVRKKLDYKTLYVEDKLVGMEKSVYEIESWLQDPSPDIVNLLIAGMGGIGKSTIAKCIYNLNFGSYDGSCFLADINKETSNQHGGMRRLQSQLLSNILKSEKEETIWNEHEGTIKVMNAISNKKVLLILDDVATSKQLEALLGTQKFYPGSKVIITTRNKELSSAFVVQPKVHSVETLSSDEAIELFSLYAFGQAQPIEPYIIWSKLFVHYCAGLPLALKVLGSSLRGNTNDVWEDIMRKMEEVPNSEIQKVLEISYETLADDKDKDLFLHIACFFEGEEKYYIVKLLAECDLYPVAGIKNLMDRCLLSVDMDGRVMMHQLIKEMGREVVRKESPKDPGKRSRLWHHRDCFKVLQDHDGTKKIEGLMMETMKGASCRSNCEECLGKVKHGNYTNFKIGALGKMKNLMLLQLDFVTFYGKYKNLPKKLRLLRWHGCSLTSIPIDICLEKLVVLDLSCSKLKHVWDDFKFIGSLKVLNLSYSFELIDTPDFGGLPGLERLILEGCSNLTKVHESIAYLRELVLLDLSGCKSLKEFPCLPTSLVSLKVSGCPNLGVLEWVKSLHSVSSFSRLKDMNLSYCNLVDSSFPNDWSSLVSLVNVHIRGNDINVLPKCIQTLPVLDFLGVGNCPKIKTIILDLQKSLSVLTIASDESLEKVQVARDSHTIVITSECPKLCEVEGRHMLQSVDKVDRKITQYLGLESNAGDKIESGIEVLHEFGIFSTYVVDKQIPSIRFMHKGEGSKVSFFVPCIHDCGSRISGFSMCVMLSQSRTLFSNPLMVRVYNATRDVLWLYENGIQKIPKKFEKLAWLSLWRCGNLLEVGDEITVHIMFRTSSIVVEECCINLIYEDDEQLDGETKEPHQVNASNQISWTDRMQEDISDYINKGERHFFDARIWLC